MDRYICIHGHFYQPPRENPWLDAIELQDSAHPYHDWNERITAECYSPNSCSRILDESGLIRKIVNNYSRISFNFGPTLLSWLEHEAPDTYRAILEADRDSRIRFSGHGSAIAQSYNHTILPLSTRRDIETQVRWGLSDFKHRFAREAEGMWLPETAVSVETLEVLAEAGVPFTILEPHQAKSVRLIGDSSWTDVQGGRIDPSMPYLAVLPSGREIVIFFYDGPISRGVAFENLLRQGENLADRLIGAFSATRKHPQLVNIATDGETYGHHHVHGDMALAYALDYIDSQKVARLTNYGEFLAKHPPTHEVEIVENTAWSCPHGLDRWRNDCGCNTGAPAGWHQAWRRPLRDALDWLRDAVASPFEVALGGLLLDPWEARNGYIEVVLDRTRADAFLDRNAKDALTQEERTRALRLLELQRNAMLMYTSCGWFFNEVSGIETTQILRYAARVIQLASELFGGDFESEFLRLLELAPSNRADMLNGRAVYERYVRPSKVDLPAVAAHFAVSSLFEPYEPKSRIYCFDIERFDHELMHAGTAQILVGRAAITSSLTRESDHLGYAVLHFGNVNLTGGVRRIQSIDHYEAFKAELKSVCESADFAAIVRLFDRELGALTFSIRSLFRDDQRRILDVVWNASLREAEQAFRQIHDRYLPLIRFHSDLGIPLPKPLYLAVESDLNLRLRRAFETDEAEVVAELLRQVSLQKVHLDEVDLSYTIRRTLRQKMQALVANPTRVDQVLSTVATIDLVRSLPFAVDVWEAQNVFFKLMKSLAARPDRLHWPSHRDEQAWLEALRALGQRLSVREIDARLAHVVEHRPLEDTDPGV